MSIIQAIIIGIIQGLTEFLPVSSTAHMILAEKILGLGSSEFTKVFIVSVHFGTILAIIAIYWKNFFQTFGFYYKLFFACLPLALAFILEKINFVDTMQDSVVVIAIALLLGGIVFLFVDKWFAGNEDTADVKVEDLSIKSALIIGLAQVLAVIPGMSRSASTIVGGMTQKLNRKSAAEFSFYLAVPTMLAATGLKVLKHHKEITADHFMLIIIGNLVAFIVAIFAIKTFIGYLTKHGFKIFGYYRIALGALILILLALGYHLNVIE